MSALLDYSELWSREGAWSADDEWVDVYVYSVSTRTYLGTFPVVDGVANLTGLDLSFLGAGRHHLVLAGQSTGTVVAMVFAVAGDPGRLPATGSSSGSVGLITLALLAAGRVLVLLRSRVAGRARPPR